MSTTRVLNAFHNALNRYINNNNTRIGLCISGGPDSISLLHCASIWIKQQQQLPLFTIMHVNHSIRKESSSEAVWISNISRQLGFQNVITPSLQWNSTQSYSHEILRSKRYECLYENAKLLGLQYLLTAHHRGDVIETFVQRIHMASGITGLANSITECSQLWPDVKVIRPFLALDKQTLIDSIPQSQQFISDPLNYHPRYLRARVRTILEADPALANDIGILSDFFRNLWHEHEVTVEKLEVAFVRRVSATHYVISEGIVPWLRNVVGRQVVRLVLGRVKGTPRMRDAPCTHLCEWMDAMGRNRDYIGTWSESDCVAKWSRKRGEFSIHKLG